MVDTDIVTVGQLQLLWRNPKSRGALRAAGDSVLRRRGLVAVKLAGGAGAMLVVAAFVEGFWSPSGVPMVAKFIVGTILWIFVIGYLGLAGRRFKKE